NTLPGMTPATCIFHQAAEIGIKPMEFIDTIIRLGLEKYGKILTPPKQILYPEKKFDTF
ncbi:MAG: UDP-N-acetylmuramate--alanine ligase, partial [Alteromonas naphthalenivorans]